jgi:hypothetical protein
VKKEERENVIDLPTTSSGRNPRTGTVPPGSVQIELANAWKDRKRVEKLTVQEVHFNIHGHTCGSSGDGKQTEQEDE